MTGVRPRCRTEYWRYSMSSLLKQARSRPAHHSTSHPNRIANLGHYADKQDLATRFWSYVDKSPGQGPKGECWVWKGHLVCKKPYGQITIEGKTCRVHRIAYQLQRGSIPEGKQVCHTCDNPPCVRGEHLFTGTTQDNTADKVKKNRQARGAQLTANRRSFKGELHPGAKLTAIQVEEIRQLHLGGLGYRPIARKFNVTFGTVAHIIQGRSWKNA